MLRSDVRFNQGGLLVAVRSSKTSKKGNETSFLPVTKGSDPRICPVVMLKKMISKFPMGPEAPLFSCLGHNSIM